MIRYLKLSLAVALLSWVTLSAAENKPGWVDRFNGWCCKNLGFGCRPAKLIETRGNAEQRPKGGDLMTFDMNTHAITAVWRDCACWSPVPVGPGELAVVSQKGIWILPMAKPADRHLVFPSTDVLELLGKGFTPDGSVLFLRSSTATECKFEPWLLPLDSSPAVKAALSPELTCGTDFNFQDIIKPGQVSASGTLTTLFHQGKYEIDLNTNKSVKPLFPDNGDVDRFDPVWTSPTSIAFVSQ